MTETVESFVVGSLRSCAQAFAAGDQVAPCAVLWADPDRVWEPVVRSLQKAMPELSVLGTYDLETRTGPALWLRCIEARVVDGAPAAGTAPVFYLPGISKDRLRAAEDCPKELAALVELQYRGIMWLHVNGKEWTPNAVLVSQHGGLGLDVAKDQATADALAGALPSLMAELVSQLRNRRLDSEFFNGLVAPDATGLLLRWLSDAEGFKARRSEPEWKAFCEQCKAEFHFDPTKEGPLAAAKLLAARGNAWGKAWQRFSEAPANYSGVVEWLRRAAPKTATMFDTAEVWPHLNDQQELELRQALSALSDLPQDEAIRRIGELEAQHAARRTYPWRALGLSPLVTVLEPLANLAKQCEAVPGAPDAQAYADHYAGGGWRVDAAALATMAACETQEIHGAVLGALRTVYLPWLEGTARNLQQLFHTSGAAPTKHTPLIKAAKGRLVLFADGLRMDVARQLASRLSQNGIAADCEWDWSTVPSVTATAKPAASPIADAVTGGDADDGFTTRLASTGQLLNQSRFVTALDANGWKAIGASELGDPTGSAWTEAGTLDKKGHSEGWKLARSVDTEVRDLASRITSLLRAGWKEIIVVTDHGWLLMPGGLPKVEMKSFLTAHQWGRCAAMNQGAPSVPPTFKWHWNAEVSIASPPGVGCFRANMEYSHGGVSLQEMVTPVLRIAACGSSAGSARLAEVKWTGAKCRVVVTGDLAGVRVDIRTRQTDATTSLLADGQARETTADGKVTVFLEDDSNVGTTAELVVLSANGQVIDSQSITLGE